MLPSPRIIAIDDNQQHLEGLVKGLNDTGVGCLAFQFTGEDNKIGACPNVRIIFADLHLNESGAVTDDTQHFSTIGGLIQENIGPLGVYLIILWTRYPEKAENLKGFLQERLRKVPPPFAVLPLDKKEYLAEDGTLNDIQKLVTAIRGLAAQHPQLVALLNWEEKVLDAAAATVFSIQQLVSKTGDEAKDAAELGRILARLGVEGVGINHVESGRFEAVNETLLPILADRIANIRASHGDSEIWKNAFKGEDLHGALSREEAARLNSFLHIDVLTNAPAISRGAVSLLPKNIDANEFQNLFGLEMNKAASEEFKFAGDLSKTRWIIVQTQAACDFAQSNPGSLPLYLGLEVTPEEKPQKLPASIWPSPVFDLDGLKQVRISGRFTVTLSRKLLQESKRLYRFRDQLLNNLAYFLHSYAARPGVTSFREEKAKAATPSKTK
jgi:hypothetical protein